ncbi:MAG: ATP-binding protein [Rhizobiaceae bacterium]
MIREKSAKQLVEELNITDETEHLEAKSGSHPDVGKSVLETICALSNEPELGGGTILLGVEKEETLFPFYTATGVTDPEKISSKIASDCATTFNIPIRVDIHTEVVDGATLVRIDVPELVRHQKPVHFKATGLPRGAFRRIGPTDVRCTEEDLAAFYQDKAQDTHDFLIVQDAEIQDIDPLAIEAYRRSRKDANPLAEELNWTDEDLLLALGALRRIGGNLRVTTTGLVVFGKQSALRRIFPAHRVDYIRVPGNAWVADPSKSLDSVDMRGPLLTLVGRVIAAIIDDLPKALKIDEDQSGQRKDIPAIPLRVIREAVVNSLMHRNYQSHQPVQIVRYGNRLLIKNPGYSLKSQERFDDPGSLIRNPHISEILHEARFAEAKGSGIRVMRQKMSESGLSTPTFVSDRDNDEFQGIFLFHHFLDERDWQWLAKFKNSDLTDEQMRALIFVREVGAIDNSSYRMLTQSDTLGASKSLRKLRTLDLLVDRGSGARTHYVPGKELLKHLNMDANAELDPLSIHANDPLPLARADEDTVRIEDLPVALRQEVKAAQLSGRLDPIKSRHLIYKLCDWKPLSAAQISNLLGKTQPYISQKFLSPMVSDSLLRYTFPEMIQHPKQKYTTVE